MTEENTLQKYVSILEGIDALRDQLKTLAFDAFTLEAPEAAKLAVKVFGSRDRAAHWLVCRSEALNNKSPLMFASENEEVGKSELIEELNTIQHGNWA